MTLHQKDGDDYAGGTRRPTAVAHAQHDIAPGVVLILGGSSTLGLAAGRALLAAGHPVALTTRNAEGTGRIHTALAPGEAGIPGGGTDFSGNRPDLFSNRPDLFSNRPDLSNGGADRCRVCRHTGHAPYAVLPVESAESLPDRCADALGTPPRHMVDFMHGRFETLVAAAHVHDIDRWAIDDIALRVRCLRAVSRAMLAERAGRCVFVSSTAAAMAAHGQGYYAAAKAAGEALYRSAGLELASRGVTTCSLRLGWVDAGRGADFIRGNDAPYRDGTAHAVPTPHTATQLADGVPTGRLVTVDEVVGTLMFLLSGAATSLNATHITLDGGFTAGKPRAGTPRTGSGTRRTG